MRSYDRTSKKASPYTIACHQRLCQLLDFHDQQEWELAEKNLIDAPEHLEIKDETGRVVWSQKGFEFLRNEEEPCSTINPSLRINARLNHRFGLFKVVEGIYQVRGYDMSNLTVVEGKTGWIVFDPMISCECSRAAMNLVEKNLGKRPVSAIVISHPHTDHFGGIRGIVSEEDVASGRVPLIVPEGFTFHAVRENCYTANVMARRAAYQYGPCLEQGPYGTLSMGIGMGQSVGYFTFLRPTEEIRETGERRVIDGVEFVFQMTKDTESPSEMCWYLPGFKALWMAELCNATMHNLYTLRGTQVRDGNAWAGYLCQARMLFGREAEVVFTAHNWPRWGNREVNEYLENTAAVYKFLNDQTVLYMNQGYTPNEISHMIRLPRKLEKVWYTRPYYGTLSHNARAVYQKFMGFYDANPVHLDPLPPVEEGTKMVEYMGGADAALEKAERDFEKGEYQWAAQVANAVVFSDPSNERARLLCADALEQLGYQAESGPWRNAYLTGAKELRFGPLDDPDKKVHNSGDILRAMDMTMMLDYLGMAIDSERSQDKDIRFNLAVTDTGERFFVHFYCGVLLYASGEMKRDQVDAVISMPRAAMALVIGRQWEQLHQIADIQGKQDVLEDMAEFMDIWDKNFPIVEP